MAKDTNDSKKVKFYKLAIMLSYITIIIVMTLCISMLVSQKSVSVLKNKVSTMNAALNVQMKMNLDSYLERMETTGTLIFSTEESYTYDATDKTNDEYEAIKTEKLISEKLYDICIMNNYVDFGIVYGNNHYVGKISNGTQKLFGDTLYIDLSAMINRPRTKDGWATGYRDDYTRIYYIKRMNSNAILVTSFYTSELANVFDHPGGISDITVQLVEKNYAVIYSSKEDETGKKLSDDIYKRVVDKPSISYVDDQYFITVNSCGDEWSIICSAPADVILKETKDIKYYVILIAIVAAVAAILFSILLLEKTINSVQNIVNVLDDKAHNDLLTGLLNKRSFEEKTEHIFKTSKKQEKHAVILLDIDNFKGVNDTLGHAYGDKVLAGVGDILRRVFSTDDDLGRLGGDEFCVLLNIPSSAKNPVEFTKSKCDDLCKAFSEYHSGADNTYKISASIGVALYPDYGNTFHDLYTLADEALYESKHRGKDTYTIYEKNTGK